MGFGDEILATAQAKAVQRRDPRPVLIVGLDGAPRWHAVWEGNPRIATDPRGDCQRIVNGPGARPYIDYAATTPRRWVFRHWGIEPGELHLSAAERALGRPVVLIEPNLKTGASPNKQWGWDRWQALVDMSPHIPWAQVGRAGTRWLRGVERIETGGFRAACGVLSGAVAAVLPEGGLHHAAAALGVPSVVLFGAFIPPAVTGYDTHRNVWVDDPTGVGWRVPNGACARAWARITPELVLENLMEIIRGL